MRPPSPPTFGRPENHFAEQLSEFRYVACDFARDGDEYLTRTRKQSVLHLPILLAIVLWIEALPEVYRILQTNLAGLPQQEAVQGLVTDRPGQRHTFHVASNSGASSSIYDFALHRDIWPEVTFTHDVELVSTTLDAIIAETGTDLSRIGALVMDTQGSELLVLKGASRVLKAVSYVKTEAADFESYKGCTTVAELTAYLAGLGFNLVAQEPFAEHPGGGRYYELLFRRRSLGRAKG